MIMRLIGGAPLLLGLVALGGCASGVSGVGGAGVDLGVEAIAFAEPAAPLAGFAPMEDDLIRGPASSYDFDLPLQPDVGPRPEFSDARQEVIEPDASSPEESLADEVPPAPADLPPGAVTSWFDLDGGMEDVPLADLNAS